MHMKDEAKRAAQVIQNGGIILHPTDTIWGIGCDPQNEKAVDRIYSLKGRPREKTMLLLVSGFDMIADYVQAIPQQAKELEARTNKPTTIIYPDAQNLAKNLLPHDKTMGMRITREPFSKTMLNLLGKPVVSTSANLSGEPYPERFEKMSETIKNGVDYIVNIYHDRGFAASPSAIVKLHSNGRLTYIRE